MKFTKKWLATAKLPELQAVYVKAREQYYNAGNSELTDVEYDTLEERIRELAPKWKYLHTTGVKTERLGKKVEVALDVPCPSLNKLVADKPQAVATWLNKVSKKYGPEIFISEKIDGSSVTATWNGGKLVQLATRGDGATGKSIRFLAPYLNLPREIEYKEKLTVRFEAAMPIKVYNKKWSGQYDSARALASAVLNRQDAAPVLKDLSFIALRVQYPLTRLSSGLTNLQRLGFKTVRGKVFNIEKLDPGLLPDLLQSLRDLSSFECDGMVVCSNASGLRPTSDRPDFAIAYKANDEASALQATVTDVLWKPSSFGVLVPKAVITPIKFGGVTVKQAALHNAKWAIERGVGIGATVKVLRSGDIIPKIVEVVKPASLSLPDPKKVGSYSWDSSNTTLVLKAAEGNQEVLKKKFGRMFSALDLDRLAGGLAEKLLQAGYTETSQLVSLTAKDFAALPGVQSMAKTYAEQMARIRNGEFSLDRLMVASGVFDRGVGRTRIQTLISVCGEGCLRKASPKLEARIAEVPGCGPAFAKMLVAGLPKFWEWMSSSGATWSPAVKAKVASGPLSGSAFSWTGYRSKEEEALVEKLGGKVVPFGGNTTVLFFTSGGKKSSKLEKAEQRGIAVSTFPAYMAKVSRK